MGCGVHGPDDDRFGQEREKVRALTYYGLDNQIDGIVLDILLRKHKAIRDALGISVPLPSDADKVIEAIFEGLLLRESASLEAMVLPGFEEYMRPKKEALHAEWTDVQEREKRSRTVFAQETIKTEEVAREVRSVREAVGSGVDLALRSLIWIKVRARSGIRLICIKMIRLWLAQNIELCP